MTWDASISIGAVINTLLFFGTLITLFVRRGADMATIKTQQVMTQEILNKFVQKFEDWQKSVQQAVTELTSAHSELRGVVGMLTHHHNPGTRHRNRRRR